MEPALVSSNDEASYSRIRARERAIEAAARACRDDGRALAALGIFVWALANRGDVAAGERAFLDAVLAAGGDWVAAKEHDSQDRRASNGFNLEPRRRQRLDNDGNGVPFAPDAGNVVTHEFTYSPSEDRAADRRGGTPAQTRRQNCNEANVRRPSDAAPEAPGRGTGSFVLDLAKIIPRDRGVCRFAPNGPF